MSVQDHLAIAEETTLGTFVTPSAMLSGVRSFSVNPNETRTPRYEKGRSLDPVDTMNGVHNPSGAGELVVESDLENIVRVLQSLGFTSITSTQIAATAAYEHGLMFDDDGALVSLSAQVQKIGNGTTVTANVRGLQVGSVTFTVSADNYLTMTFDYVAVEAQVAGTNFGDAESSPAAITVSYPTLVRGFQFDDVVIKLGVTPTWDGTKKLFTIADGTTLSLESLSLTIELPRSQVNALGSKYAAEIIRSGSRAITGELVVRNNTPTTAYFTKLRSGTTEALDIKFSGDADAIESGHTNELQITIPQLSYNSGELFGAVTNEVAAETLTIPFMAELHAASGVAIGVRIKNESTSY